MSAELPLVGEEVGDYVDSDNLSRNAHIDNDGNFSENIGSRTLVTKNPASGPYADVTIAGLKSTFKLKQLSNHIDLQIPLISSTSNGTGSTIVFGTTLLPVIPQHSRPRDATGAFIDWYVPVMLKDNGAPVAGHLKIGSDGILTFKLNSGTFTNAAAAGVYRTDVGWDCKY